jgi:hypothetical protein
MDTIPIPSRMAAIGMLSNVVPLSPAGNADFAGTTLLHYSLPVPPGRPDIFGFSSIFHESNLRRRDSN